MFSKLDLAPSGSKPSADLQDLPMHRCRWIDGGSSDKVPTMFPRRLTLKFPQLPHCSDAVGTSSQLCGSRLSLPGTAKGRCLPQLLAVHFDSRHCAGPMSSRLPFTMSGAMDVVVFALVPGRLSRSLSRRDRTWCHHQFGFVGSVPSGWTSRDPSGISGFVEVSNRVALDGWNMWVSSK